MKWILLATIALAGCRYHPAAEPQSVNQAAEEQIINELEQIDREAADVGAEVVTNVRDGDTLVIASPWSPWKHLVWSVRVKGIDTGETDYRAKCPYEKEMGLKAKAMTKKLVAESGNLVMLEDVEHDKYGGRLVATVILRDGSVLGQRLLDAGLAKPFSGDTQKTPWCASASSERPTLTIRR